jgi:hypothetical protein
VQVGVEVHQRSDAEQSSTSIFATLKLDGDDVLRFLWPAGF